MATKPKRTVQPKNAKIAEPGVTPENQAEWIAVAAYFRAEQRGFQEGYEMEDWLDAEKEFNELLKGAGQ